MATDDSNQDPAVDFPPEGEVVTSHEVNPKTGQPDPTMPVVETETIVHDVDPDTGELLGWHKEAEA